MIYISYNGNSSKKERRRTDFNILWCIVIVSLSSYLDIWILIDFDIFQIVQNQRLWKVIVTCHYTAVTLDYSNLNHYSVEDELLEFTISEVLQL